MAAGARPIRHDGDGNKGQSSPKVVSTGPARITPLKELQLVDLHRAGGPQAQEALGELIRAYQRRIYSICLRMVHHPDDASDLTQDALVKVIEGLSSYNGQSKLSTWVIRVTMNCCLTHLRKQKLRSHESLDAPGRKGTEAGFAAGAAGKSGPDSSGKAISSGREPQPAQRIEQDQKRTIVLQALDSIEADMRSILVLRDLQDLDYQQLAEVLDIPIGTVKSRLFRARAALRQAIEARGGV